MAEGQTVLELRHVTKLYAGTVALEDVSPTVRRGEVHRLIGKNEAGESAPVGIISGLVAPNSGEIWINGQKYTSLSPVTAKHQRISIIMQEPQVIEGSAVMENFLTPSYLDNKKVIGWNEMRRRAVEVLGQTSFPIDISVKMRNLSINERQLLLVVKACSVENTEIVITDEVSVPLNQEGQAIPYRIIDDLISAGETAVFTPHHTEEFLRVYDWVTVIQDGHNVSNVMRGDLDKKKLTSLIVSSTSYDEWIMGDMSTMVQEGEVFVLKNFTNYGKLRNISMSARKGEIVGLADLRSSGWTELMKNVVGIGAYDGGAVWVAGGQKRYRSSVAARDGGVPYLTEERETEGLIPIVPIQKNLTVSVLPRISRWGVFQTKEKGQLADDLIRILGVKAFFRKQNIGQLSGEDKQKVLAGKTMTYTSQVCLLDEPTRGVDIEAKEPILNTTHRELRKQPCVIITSPGVEGLIKIYDRTLVLYEDKIIDWFSREESSEKQTYRAIQGEAIHIDEMKKS